jgi:phage tail protein X
MKNMKAEGESKMKSLRFLLSVVLLSLSTWAFAQEHANMPKSAAAKSEAQLSFDALKALAGEWEGPVTLVPAQPQMKNGEPLHVSMRVTSRGNALVHEIPPVGVPDDPAHYDHPVTMLYLDGDRLTLVHYCDAGNRPRMVARSSVDAKTVEFDLIDVSGSTQFGHMQHAVFTIIDANHHIEDWTYIMPGDKPIHAHFDLQRAK